ncbi:MAG: peptide-methionine (S)-S-oxide reductase MsrA [gamma proteobacterium symbiont of Bathyaustriella thionipta]|nr:peptide-methionine (S)-S-oxide reductase MsrA [gamma proteobacterium symbiont of Bathyaustriella thionipta]MCU7950074.1 peptide-methionine (S)-S-oxide reductase MsrA [gamma proteobacterium symbiont of Bathyaustriella thionipta]MCU7953924.1 peptide-methionine (S)-S-oxide reductase MsrA [gamma proteobacterium symbiont of Bathyaustriella thionipta]MCU7956659.1 peptide-methionine (S)-S-oxide reductase MsrA [gamma proteobacterium symbiont of Bathyaustriella thionipta]MCU7967867.1 peptide-methioni
MTIATLGGGCFWCLDATLKNLKGIANFVSGYADGTIENPTYQQICTGTTGHAEVVQITYDSNIINFQTLLQVFFTIHDPTTLNRQGADTGTQYRSIILCHNDEQLSMAKDYIAQLDASDIWANPIVTEVKPLETFYEAEKYHQNYFQLNPTNGYCQAVISPKLSKLKAEYQSLLK